MSFPSQSANQGRASPSGIHPYQLPEIKFTNFILYEWSIFETVILIITTKTKVYQTYVSLRKCRVWNISRDKETSSLTLMYHLNMPYSTKVYRIFSCNQGSNKKVLSFLLCYFYGFLNDVFPVQVFYAPQQNNSFTAKIIHMH